MRVVVHTGFLFEIIIHGNKRGAQYIGVKNAMIDLYIQNHSSQLACGWYRVTLAMVATERYHYHMHGTSWVARCREQTVFDYIDWYWLGQYPKAVA